MEMPKKMNRKIYVASSWRNAQQPEIVQLLRSKGHGVYDFRTPDTSHSGFAWSDIDPAWESWTREQFLAGLKHPIAVESFEQDLTAMEWADTCVLVMPCGRSAHLEAGWFIGRGKPTAILLADGGPELMYKLSTVCPTTNALISWLENVARRKA